MEYRKLDLTIEELFQKVERHELMIGYIKETMVPFFIDNDHIRYEMPEGYMEYEKKHFYRNIY